MFNRNIDQLSSYIRTVHSLSKADYFFQLIEEKALLENELEQTRGQKEAEQRLRDELKGKGNCENLIFLFLYDY